MNSLIQINQWWTLSSSESTRRHNSSTRSNFLILHVCSVAVGAAAAAILPDVRRPHYNWIPQGKSGHMDRNDSWNTGIYRPLDQLTCHTSGFLDLTCVLSILSNLLLSCFCFLYMWNLLHICRLRKSDPFSVVLPEVSYFWSFLLVF